MAQDQILADHKKLGKKLIPPAKYKLGMTEITYVERVLPHLVWLGLILETHQPSAGRVLAKAFIKRCLARNTAPHSAHLCFHGHFARRSPDELKAMFQGIASSDVASIIRPLETYVRCYPEGNPFLHLIGEGNVIPPIPEDIQKAKAAIGAMLDRRGQLASAVQAVCVELEIETETLSFAPHLEIPVFDAIFDDSTSPKAERAGIHARLHTNQIYAFYKETIGDAWAPYFWNRGKDLEPLSLEVEIPEPSQDTNAPLIIRFASAYENHCRTVLNQIWARMPVDIFESEAFEVIGALLARQVNLAVRVAYNPGLWDYQVGPLVLRAMTDCHITIAWILGDPLDRARKFISYGLGQEKLVIEHLRSEAETMHEPHKKEMEYSIQAREAWVNGQHYMFLQEVDLGSWSGISTREMAKQANCLDLYHFAYTPWSQAAHGIWNHTGRFDSKPTANPLHKCINQPYDFPMDGQIDVLVNTTKYLDKSLTAVVSAYKLEMKSFQPPFDWLFDHLKILTESDHGEQGEQKNSPQVPSSSMNLKVKGYK